MLCLWLLVKVDIAAWIPLEGNKTVCLFHNGDLFTEDTLMVAVNSDLYSSKPGKVRDIAGTNVINISAAKIAA